MGIEIPTATRCLLCGQRFAPDWSNPESEHPNGRFLICAGHGAEDLTEAGLENLWIGSGNWAPDLRPGHGAAVVRAAWVTPVEERGPYTLAFQLDSDDLLVIGATYANVDVAWLRADLGAPVPQGLTALERLAHAEVSMMGLAPLVRAVREGWMLCWVQRAWDGLALRFSRGEPSPEIGVMPGERVGSLRITAAPLAKTARGVAVYGLAAAWEPPPA